jgi:hypothetical protein
VVPDRLAHNKDLMSKVQAARQRDSRLHAPPLAYTKLVVSQGNRGARGGTECVAARRLRRLSLHVGPVGDVDVGAVVPAVVDSHDSPGFVVVGVFGADGDRQGFGVSFDAAD